MGIIDEIPSLKHLTYIEWGQQYFKYAFIWDIWRGRRHTVWRRGCWNIFFKSNFVGEFNDSMNFKEKPEYEGGLLKEEEEFELDDY